MRFRFDLALGLLATVMLVAAGSANAQLVEGPWRLTVTELSQNCGDPPASPSVVDVELQRSGAFVLFDPESPVPNISELAGTVSGDSLSIGFEVLENPGITAYASAANSLTIAQDGESFSGDLPWSYFSDIDCSGVDSWSAVRLGTAPEPDSLTGEWEITLAGVSENCGDGLGSPAVFDSEAVQFDEQFVRFAPPPVPGLGEIVGNVSGQTLHVGLEVFEDGGFTFYDSQSNSLTIAQDFNSFSGTSPWDFYFPLECTGVDHVEAVYLPEPGSAVLGILALVSICGVRRTRRAGSMPAQPAGASSSRR